MANHRAQAQFERARWRLNLLLPLWASQLTVTMITMGLFSWRMGGTVDVYRRGGQAAVLPVFEIAGQAVNIGLSFFASIWTCAEIARFMAESLTPWLMLLSNIIKLACASIILGVDIAVYLVQRDVGYPLVGLSLDAITMMIAIALTAYAAAKYRSLSSSSEYEYSVNAKAYGFNDGLDGETPASSRLSVHQPLDRRASMIPPRLGWAFKTAHEPLPVEDPEQPPVSYSHERDTQFDQYIARRGLGKNRPAVVVDSSKGQGRGGTAGGSLPLSSQGKTRTRGSSNSSQHTLVTVVEEDADGVKGPGGQGSDRKVPLEKGEVTDSGGEGKSCVEGSSTSDEFVDCM
ncbi:hypothetical protein HIM_03490 [Hirsutella minnesotensis 3608]|uniref:Uncharacterized protein n=1 Tax=Hirsutella minnesotensis 3608 TaxID=1043627 RepID=A0A0F8A6J1_9HYPO|nr:hypothetical protein HIM_03490 [Hirsutella minnesotensis 3608]